MITWIQMGAIVIAADEILTCIQLGYIRDIQYSLRILQNTTFSNKTIYNTLDYPDSYNTDIWVFRPHYRISVLMFLL